MTYWKLVWRNLTRRRSRFVFTLSAIAVGIASVVTLLSLGSGLEAEIRRQADVLGAELLVTPKGWCAYEQISVLTGESLPEALAAADVDRIRRIDGLTAVPYLTQRAVIRNQPVPLVGVLAGPMKEFREWGLARGEYRLDERHVVVGHAVAEQFDLDVGDTLRVRGSGFTVSGVLAPVGNRDDLAVYMDLSVAQRVYRTGGKVSFVAVRVDDIRRIDEYIAKIQGAANVAVVSDKQLLRSVLAIVGSVGNALQLIAAVAVLAACFGITNTMMTAIYERRREIGVLDALGAKKSTIFSVFVGESAVYGLLGGVLGVAAGFAFSYVAAPYIGQNEFTAFLGSEQSVKVFDVGIAIEALVFAVLVAVLSGLYPALRAAKLSPVEAIGYE